ncbi:electron transfer flavoprotein subunit alpha/FixB family protein [Oerskovia flava]|uniref:electron transfer flavoprotein subunit alpha/FixB family protein n=1 Tax=Oerskovia flava TaxID=2986422 RepID=UPI0022409B57|nr:electron transfer flavoprotein subunit alpha/FixB family protein [Oerskovia sp. JB1-3-2]
MTEQTTPRTNRTVLVLLDTPATELRSSALELLTIARGLGRVEAVTLEAPSVPTLAQLSAYGVEIVLQAELPAAVRGGDDAHLSPVVAEALAAALRLRDADAVILSATFANKEAAARLAHLTGAGLVIDATSVTESAEPGPELADAPPAGSLVAGKRVFAGSWDTSCVVRTETAVFTVRPNSIVPEPAPVAVATEVEGFAVEVSELATVARSVSREVHERAVGGRPSLAEAAVVVAGGRGTDGDFGPVEDLADALGAAVGASRDAVYEGWFDEFVGQTGVTVAPRLYIGAGISGAPHHRGGMQASQVIVAVNSDPECPLFEISDFAVVGDLADVLPQAAQVIREHKG